MKKKTIEKINAKSLPKFSDLHNKFMKDPTFRKAFNDLEPEYVLINAIIDARIKKNISQKMLARRLGTGQSAISRLESGTYNPTFKFAQKLAKALETDLTFTFSK